MYEHAKLLGITLITISLRCVGRRVIVCVLSASAMQTFVGEISYTFTYPCGGWHRPVDVYAYRRC